MTAYRQPAVAKLLKLPAEKLGHRIREIFFGKIQVGQPRFDRLFFKDQGHSIMDMGDRTIWLRRQKDTVSLPIEEIIKTGNVYWSIFLLVIKNKLFLIRTPFKKTAGRINATPFDKAFSK
ncbi:hypothetical protein Q757_06835 [Oenococcus alcoholitolerans]|uniref:Uncharacterized protein n=1 Tax=Oenococcus alcoholitolerans TaxID=931074 RepID=A0ABR4XQ56_9LACO|nr:hypothetical protein Q757_06835 [Oenococcus alcoholitolerans]